MKICDPVHMLDAHIFHTSNGIKNNKDKENKNSHIMSSREEKETPCSPCLIYWAPTQHDSTKASRRHREVLNPAGTHSAWMYYNTCMCTSSMLLTWKTTKHQVHPIQLHHFFVSPALTPIVFVLLAVCLRVCVYVVTSYYISVWLFTCIKFRTIYCSNHWIQLPACQTHTHTHSGC